MTSGAIITRVARFCFLSIAPSLEIKITYTEWHENDYNSSYWEQNTWRTSANCRLETIAHTSEGISYCYCWRSYCDCKIIAMFLYLNFYLCVKLDSLSFSFPSLLITLFSKFHFNIYVESHRAILSVSKNNTDTFSKKRNKPTLPGDSAVYSCIDKERSK